MPNLKPDNKPENFYKNKRSANIPQVLLVGYNGATNTGSEARLLTVIDDARRVLGSDVHITVPTLNEENLRRYLKEEPTLHIAPIPSIFFFAIRRLVREHDLVMLVEGSTYMDSWTSALLWAFLWTTKYAHKFGKPCIAYAVDVGKLSSSNKRRVQKQASKTDLIITRTNIAADRLKSIGVTAPIEVTADTAFNFQVDDENKNFLKKVWPEAKEMVGLAVVDFYMWPVVIRPWGRRENVYRWPYYFSRTKKRRQATEDLADGWAAQVDQIIENYGKNVAILCMEEVDQPLAEKIQNKVQHPGQARIFSSRNLNASQMTSILRSLVLLVTSRYHAAVLSLEATIPQIAFGHDNRLRDFYQEIGLYDYFIEDTSPKRWEWIKNRVNCLLENPKQVENILKSGLREQVERANRNRALLRAFLKNRGWEVEE
jgi:polysaccharide pyruvyl transferase WcaK-like protein